MTDNTGSNYCSICGQHIPIGSPLLLFRGKLVHTRCFETNQGTPWRHSGDPSFGHQPNPSGSRKEEKES